MKSFWSLSLKYIRKYISKSVSICIFIIISVFLITSVFVIKDGLIISRKENAINAAGGFYDILALCGDDYSPSKLDEFSFIKETSLVVPFGQSKIENTKYTISINGYDDNICNFLNFTNIKGKLPQNDNEIALESWIIDALPEKYNIGDKITLNSILQHTNNFGDIEIRNTEFTIVGAFDHTFLGTSGENIGIGYVTKSFAESKLKNTDIDYTKYIMLKKDCTIFDAIEELSKQSFNSPIKFMENIHKIGIYSQIKLDNSVCLILFAIILIFSIIIINNIFNIIITDMREELGILRIIGSSANMVKNLVLLQGIELGMISIPIGIFAGNVLTKILIIGVSGKNIFPQLFRLPFKSILCITILGFMFIILGSYFSVRKILKLSPMETAKPNIQSLIYKNKRIKLDSKSIITKKVSIRKNIALITFFRNTSKFLTNIISLSLAIAIFLVINYICIAVNPITSLKANKKGDITINSHSREGMTQDEVERIVDIDQIKILEKQMSTIDTILLKENMLTNDGINYINERAKQSEFDKNYIKSGNFPLGVRFDGYENKKLESMSEYVISGNINIDNMNSNSAPEVCIVQNMNYNNYTNISIGDTIRIESTIYDSDGNITGVKGVECIIGAILEENSIVNNDGRLSAALIFSEKLFKEITNMSGYSTIYLSVDNNNISECEYILENTLVDSNDIKITTFEEELESCKSRYYLTISILYSFMIIISFMAMFILFQIFKINMVSSTREFGMLEAMGMSIDEIKKILKTEGFIYGIISTIFGSILGCIATYTIYIKGRLYLGIKMAWSLPKLEIITITIVVIGLTYISSSITSRKILKKSIIELIKSDIE